jgi:hypothetical protein
LTSGKRGGNGASDSVDGLVAADIATGASIGPLPTTVVTINVGAATDDVTDAAIELRFNSRDGGDRCIAVAAGDAVPSGVVTFAAAAADESGFRRRDDVVDVGTTILLTTSAIGVPAPVFAWVVFRFCRGLRLGGVDLIVGGSKS